MSYPTSYLKGLNTLRFFAAFFVLISHGHLSLRKLQIVQDREYAVFERGGDSVELFFTLSGFLITYLLLLEVRKTGDVDIKFFYLRRILRIWPLYFLCLAAGLFVLGFVYPRVMAQERMDFPLVRVLLMFLFFMPNLGATYYSVGLIYPLWSIGIEEQFYLFWAPFVRLFRKRPLPLILTVLVLSCGWYLFLNGFLKEQLDSKLFSFLRTFKFYNMAIGALLGYLLFFHIDRYRASVLSRPFVQVLLLAILLYHYLFGITGIPIPLLSILLSVVYGCIFINISSLPNPVVNLEIQPFKYLGEISYGIYMYHMFVDYVLRYSFSRLNFTTDPLTLQRFKLWIASAYFLLLLGLTIAVAALSYRYFESYVLSLRRLYEKKKPPDPPYGPPAPERLKREATVSPSSPV